MKLIVGLGNPGQEYEKTRHNAGFMAIDFYASKHNASFKLVTKLDGMLSSINIGGEKVILLKPMTYMNNSGKSISEVIKYYNIDINDVLIISDDLDSNTGRIRLRASGSAGGHNGHKSIIQYLGTENYKRLKIGISRSSVIPVISWVLQNFSETELAAINAAIDKASLAIDAFISSVSFEKISSLYSTK